MARIRTSRNSANISKIIIWTIACYIRLSKDDGNDVSLSVVNQKKILTDHLQNDFSGEYTLIDFYIDDGDTGTDYDRPNFQRMLGDIEQGKINCVICKNLSRAFRNYADQGYFLENFFPLHGTRFIALGNPKVDSYLDPDGVNGLEVPINGILNDRYAAKTSHDVRRTFDMKRKNGEFIGSFAPYGYKKRSDDKNSFCIDDEAARVVQDIFNWFVNEGMSRTGIAKRLNGLGIPNPSAYKKTQGLSYCNPHKMMNDEAWSSRTIGQILENQMYIGDMVQGKYRVISYKVHNQIETPPDEWYIVKNTHDAIINKELFDAAQSLCARDTRTAPTKSHVYLLSGFIRCADCGHAMTRKTAKELVYYTCRTYRDKAKCTKHSIRSDVVEHAVLLAIQKQIELVASMDEVIKAICEAPRVQTKSLRLTQLLKMRTQELAKLQQVKESLYVDWKMGEITRDEYQHMKAKFVNEITQLEEVVQHLQEECHVMESGIKADDPYLSIFLKHQNIEHLERGILVELVDVVLIHETGEIEIKFNFADQYQRIVEYIENRNAELTILEGNVV